MFIGLVGKPNCGKSSFFSAATLVDVGIASYPFTTIEPNKGVTYVRAECPHVEIGIKCNPKNSKCENGIRLIPINIVDIAGLVPDAHLGKGMGNQFLDNVREADALIQIIDLSGGTDLEGNPCEGCDPAEEIIFLEKEISYWIEGIIKRNWNKIRGKEIGGVADVLTGLKVGVKECESAAEKLGLAKERISWDEGAIFKFADEIRRISKPIIIAANKCDLKNAKENLKKLRERFPEKIIIPTCAQGELALRKAAEKGVIHYIPGEKKFEILKTDLDEKQRSALEILKKILEENEFGTGVQQVINEAAFKLLGLIVVYPVEDENKFTNHFGDVLPDAYLVRKGTTVHEFAGKIHTDLQKNFICAVNAKTKRRVGKEYVLQNNDVIKIVAGSSESR